MSQFGLPSLHPSCVESTPLPSSETGVFLFPPSGAEHGGCSGCSRNFVVPTVPVGRAPLLLPCQVCQAHPILGLWCLMFSLPASFDTHLVHPYALLRSLLSGHPVLGGCKMQPCPVLSSSCAPLHHFSLPGIISPICSLTLSSSPLELRHHESADFCLFPPAYPAPRAGYASHTVNMCLRSPLNRSCWDLEHQLEHLCP